MPDMLPSALNVESEASGKTCSLKYCSVTPHTWYNVSIPRARERKDRAEVTRCSQAFLREQNIAGGDCRGALQGTKCTFNV